MSLAGSSHYEVVTLGEETMSLFGGGKKKGGGSGGTQPTSEVEQQKRNASKRDHILRTKAPQHVVDKWNAINNLKGRDHNKNSQKSEFTAKLLADCEKFEDSYWQQEVTESYSRGHVKTGHWMLRSRADAMHGGGLSGATAVQDAIDAGIYRSKKQTVKSDSGKHITIEHVMLTGEKFSESHEASFMEKLHGGARTSNDTFTQHLVRAMGSDEQEVMKRPAAAPNDMMAITDIEPAKKDAKKDAKKAGSSSGGGRRHGKTASRWLDRAGSCAAQHGSERAERQGQRLHHELHQVARWQTDAAWHDNAQDQGVGGLGGPGQVACRHVG